MAPGANDLTFPATPVRGGRLGAMGEPWLRRSAGSAALLLALGREYGADPGVLLRDTGLDLPTLHDPRTSIAASQELRLVANLVDAVPVPDLGFVAGRRYHLGTHPEWSYALVSSPTLGDALDVVLAYAELTYTYSRLRAERDRHQLRIVIDDHAVPAPVRRFLLERDLAAAFSSTFATLAGSERPIVAAALAVPAPADPEHRATYTRLLGVEPEWSAPEHVLTCPSAALAATISGSVGEAVAEQAREACAEELIRRRRRESFADDVRRAILAAPLGSTQTQVADRLHLSLRTLRRRLAEEGVTYRLLAQETWQGLARDLLVGGLTVQQVSDRLGYADPSSFTRAFKAWSGESPGAYARRRR